MSPSNLNPAQNDNNITLDAYQNKTQEYVENTPAVDDELKTWIRKALAHIPKDGKILEIGSGFGRDAEYIQELGYDIVCSDAVDSFVEILKQKGFHTRKLNVLADTINDTYAMVFADAVLLHFTPEEAASVTKKVCKALTNKGIFALRVKKGNGPVWTDAKLGAPRYFYYWQPDDLKAMLTDSGFTVLSTDENNANNNDWIGLIAQKTKQV